MKKELKKEYIAIPTNTGLTFIKKKDIIYCLSEGAYTHIYVSNGSKFTVTRNLKAIEGVLPSSHFIRIHQSHLINMDYAKGYLNGSYNCVKMCNGEELAVARNRKKDFLALFTKL